MAASRARRPKSAARSSRRTATKKAAVKRNGDGMRGASDFSAIIEMLKKDHDTVGKLFKKFERMKDKNDDARYELVREICDALTVHAAIEEQYFYPAARSASGEGEEEDDMLDEAEVEHSHIKEIVQQLKDGNEDDPLCDAKVKVLGEYVDHHVEEEENELFPKLRKLKDSFDGVYAQMVELREQLEAGESAFAVGEPEPAAGTRAS
jgi:hemerythrin superfamily protein